MPTGDRRASAPGPVCNRFGHPSPLTVSNLSPHPEVTYQSATSKVFRLRCPETVGFQAQPPVTRLLSNICKQPQQDQRITAVPCPYPIETKRLPCRDRNQGEELANPVKPGKDRQNPKRN